MHAPIGSQAVGGATRSGGRRAALGDRTPRRDARRGGGAPRDAAAARRDAGRAMAAPSDRPPPSRPNPGSLTLQAQPPPLSPS
eukprot:6817924-Prymnesium_polylepis.1